MANAYSNRGSQAHLPHSDPSATKMCISVNWLTENGTKVEASHVHDDMTYKEDSVEKTVEG